MSDTLHLYAGGSDLANVEGSAGLLCELAPDSPSLQRATTLYTPVELLGEPDESLQRAYPLVTKLLASAPSIEGLPVLRIFEEDLLEQVSYILRTFHLDRWIASHGFSTCRFFSYSPWLDRLSHVQQLSGTTYEVRAEVPLSQTSRIGRMLRKVWRSYPTPSQLMRHAVPHRARCLAAMPRRKHAEEAPRGGIWFYSTSYNCSRVGLEYESYFPGKVNFVVEDPTTGGKRLRESEHDFDDLYAWSRASDIPSKSEVRSAGQRITHALAAVPLTEPEGATRSILLQSDWWHHFLARGLPFALHNSRALSKWGKAVAPELLVVGNAGWERALLLREDSEHVPAVMLQHGIMHWVYAVTEDPVDLFLVRGQFFRRVINERMRHKTVVSNPQASTQPTVPTGESERTDIVFITQPHEISPLFHEEDLRDILRSLLRVAHANRRRLVVRVHPMEKVAFYERISSELQVELGVQCDLSFSQGPGMEKVLDRSCTAILYFSTMFLDCLRHGIPIVSFGWHWFPNRHHFEKEGVFHFAADLRHFEALVQEGIEGKLPRRKVGIEEFLAPTKPEDIRRCFQEMWDQRDAQPVTSRMTRSSH